MALKTTINQSRFKPLAWLSDGLVPPACPVCLKPVAGDDGLCATCWQDIQFISGPVCRRTGLPMPIDLGDETISPLARAQPPPYDMARAVFAYKNSGAALIKRMKFGDRPELAQLLARLIYTRLPHMLPRHALLLPVPLHRRRLLWRRFNQSSEICCYLAKLSGQSMALEAVVRIRPTPQQIGLTRAGSKTQFARCLCRVSEPKTQAQRARRGDCR